MYITDQNNHNSVILKLDDNINSFNSILSEDNENYELKCPCDVKVKNYDNIIITDYENYRIKILSNKYDFIMNIGHTEEILFNYKR